jgi:hypothetical protein
MARRDRVLMAGAIAAVVSVVASVGSAVVSVVATVASVIGSVLGPVFSTIGSLVSGLGSIISSTIVPILQTIGTIANFVIEGIGATLQGIVSAAKATLGPVIEGINGAITTILEAITAPLEPILKPLADALGVINAELKAIDSAVTAALGPVREAIDLIGTVASLKIIYDMLTGQANVFEAIEVIAKKGKLGMMQAIAELSSQIVTTSVGIMDKYDTEINLLAASIDTFDEKLAESGRNLMDAFNAEVAATITPKFESVGRTSEWLNRKIAALYRRVEDKPWFEAMLLKILR